MKGLQSRLEPPWVTAGIALVGLLMAAPATGQGPVNRASDSVFLEVVGSRVVSPCPQTGDNDNCFPDPSTPNAAFDFVEAHATTTFTIAIDRVVGPGIQNVDVDVNGRLLNPQTLVANGVVAPSVVVRINASGNTSGAKGDSGLYTHVVKVNGTQVGGYVSQGPSVSKPITVPVSLINFGTRNLAGGPPTPGQNTIEIDSNPSNFVPGCECGSMVGATITVSALYPIILVHGIRADNTWFPTSGFTLALDAMKVPYGIAVQKGANSLNPGSIYDTGATLRSVVPALAKTFGTTKVHMVAHSKGGLWSRFFLQPGGPYSSDLVSPPTTNNFGVLSLTTLDTPHHGAFVADIAASSQFWRLFPAIASPLTQTNPLDPGTVSDFVNNLVLQIADLTRPEVEQFNSNYPGGSPTAFQDVDGTIYPTVYSAVAADADIGDKTNSLGFRFVDATDCAGDSLPTTLCGVLYQIAGAEDETAFTGQLVSGIWRLTGFTAPVFQPNDLVVTQQSARYNVFADPSTIFPFRPILDPVRKNHSTVGDACVAGGAAFFDITGAQCTTGMGVLGAIQQIQPLS